MKTGSRPSGRRPPMAELPAGTVTFLFTDIEGSTRLWEQHPEAMPAALARHDGLLTEGIQSHGGGVVKSRGEGDTYSTTRSLQSLGNIAWSQGDRAATRCYYTESLAMV